MVFFVKAAPGFSEETLSALKAKAEISEYPIVCSLIIDEMAIRKSIEWDGNKCVGYVDLGPYEFEENQEAREVIVFMVVCINKNWRVPIGYFFINGLGGEQRCSLVNQCLYLLHQNGIIITSLTCDAAASNLSMFTYLGCNLNSECLKTSFSHPVTNNNIYIFLDPCHMIKLVRNALGDKKTFYDGEGNKISWNLILKLHELQMNEGLHLGNKILKQHFLHKQQNES